MGTSFSLPNKPVGRSDDLVLEIYQYDNEELRALPDIEDSVDSYGRLLNQLPTYDAIHLGPEGKVVGKYDDNPFLNSMSYEVEFVDGQVWEYSANVIAESMLTRVDPEGFSTTLMEGIMDCCNDESVAVTKEDKYVYAKSGQWCLSKMMAGWDVLVK